MVFQSQPLIRHELGIAVRHVLYIYIDFIVMPIAMHVVELIRNLKVKWGMVEEDWYARVMEPVVSYLRSFALVARSEYFTQHPKLLETWQDGMVMTVAVLGCFEMIDIFCTQLGFHTVPSCIGQQGPSMS